MSNVFQLMNQQFPAMFKSPPGDTNVNVAGVAGRVGAGGSQAGQKVVCTPEVSLYQYSSEMAAAAAGGHGGALQRIMEEKGLVGGVEGSNVVGNGSVSGGLPTSVGGPMSGVATPGPNGGFQCGFCGKTFQQKNTFQNHLRSHREGDDPYQCDICGKTFAGKNNHIENFYTKNILCFSYLNTLRLMSFQEEIYQKLCRHVGVCKPIHTLQYWLHRIE